MTLDMTSKKNQRDGATAVKTGDGVDGATWGPQAEVHRAAHEWEIPFMASTFCLEAQGSATQGPPARGPHNGGPPAQLGPTRTDSPRASGLLGQTVRNSGHHPCTRRWHRVTGGYPAQPIRDLMTPGAGQEQSPPTLPRGPRNRGRAPLAPQLRSNEPGVLSPMRSQTLSKAGQGPCSPVPAPH